ncbi:carbamoyltransferase HypF [Rhodovulum sp. DZ06]|uniref:carbamoyltransferase HypF n=1 Tax=Rhodovulum sp. DZ06 TaxID=3425126 RepID=UPI003D3288CF
MTDRAPTETPNAPASAPGARAIRVRGAVQGVGFRPFVWRLARDRGIRGDVRNDADGVLIHAEGAALDAFEAALWAEAPPLARIDAVDSAPADPRDPPDFAIAATGGGAARTRVTPDAAICDACRAEILDPAARRHGHAFANCTHCGPRLTILLKLPYDRPNTAMGDFPMCAACRAEYEDPADRRFHAQPVCCPDCGPVLWLEPSGAPAAEGEARPETPGADPIPGPTTGPIAAAAARLKAGEVLAIKGLGGFHLACDALNEEAVATLRARKRRPMKPFALMAEDLAALAPFAEVSEDEAALLTSAAAPITLLAAGETPLAPSVAPGQDRLGWMLAATPLHVLLSRAFGGPLVMTSGNLSGEPMAVGNQEAREKLSSFADAFLLHDRRIARRVDDGVARVTLGAPRILRRARGQAPDPVPLPDRFADAPAVLAYGGHLKAAACLARDGAALLTHHLGDLDDPLTAEEFERALSDYAALFDHAPAALACDAHPDYRTTLLAEARALESGLPLVRVQHHHAHVAAAMAEHGWEGGPVLGLALDGLGWGPDGAAWGGELLLCDYAEYTRVGHLRPAPLPGGGAAQTDPWRNLLARLDQAGMEAEAEALLPGKPLAPLRAAMARGVNAPLSSSMGRLFDAAAALVGCAPDRQSFEGEAAMALEALARKGMGQGAPAAPMEWDGEVLDPAPLWPALLALEGPEARAAAFHRGLAGALAQAAAELADAHGAEAIAITGGVAQNALLLELLVAGLEAQAPGLPLLIPAAVPAGDGGLALGQTAVAMARLQAEAAG